MKKDTSHSTTSLPEAEPSTLDLISLRVWVLAIICCLLIIALLLWSIFAHVSTEVTGTGILLPGRAQMYPATSPHSGIIKKILAHIGQPVKEGQPLIYVTSTGNTTEKPKQTVVTSPIDGQIISISAVVGKYYLTQRMLVNLKLRLLRQNSMHKTHGLKFIAIMNF